MLKFLDSLINGDTFNTRIKVTFINHENDSVMDEAEFEQYELPESFEEPIPLFINKEEWLIVKAEPNHALQYSLHKKLVLRILKKSGSQVGSFLNDAATSFTYDNDIIDSKEDFYNANINLLIIFLALCYFGNLRQYF